MADLLGCLGSGPGNRGGTNEEGREDKRRNKAGDHQAIDRQLQGKLPVSVQRRSRWSKVRSQKRVQ